MRALISKVVAGSMIAGAALMISACKPAATPDTNVTETNMTETNVSEDMTMTENGGMTLTWLEDGSRYSVGFEAPPNIQVDYAVKQTVDVLVGVADGMRPGR